VPLLDGLENYRGREQAYVKHFLLGEYLESWAHKVASHWPEVAYVDGFCGPWQEAGEDFEDTSFGIALRALTRAKASWNALGRSRKMRAYLVEKDKRAYEKLQTAIALFPEIEIKTYPGSFIDHAATIRRDIPKAAFAFMFLDPKGWAIDMERVRPLLERPNSEVVFNFMFEFINRAASMQSPALAASLDALIREPGWRSALEDRPTDVSEADHRKTVMVNAFSRTLGRLGKYRFVAETTVLRPTRDRPLYSLVYATRSERGLEVFRASQVKAMAQQDIVRGATKMAAHTQASDQVEMFPSFSQVAPAPSAVLLERELKSAEASLIACLPSATSPSMWSSVWPQILERHVITRTQINEIANRLRLAGTVAFPDWAPRQRTPRDGDRLFLP